jgi:hypothetical protein
MRISKIITLSISLNHLRGYPSTQPSVNMEPAGFPDPINQLQWIIGTQGLELIDKQRLESVKTGVAVLQKRHGEIVIEKESKILALEFQLLKTSDEKAQQDENVKRFEEENAKLKEEVIKLKADSAAIEARAESWKTWSEELCKTGQRLMEALDVKEKALESAKKINTNLKRRAEAKQRQDRRIAIKLLSSVMELDGDVAVPGKQRPVSERRSIEEAPPTEPKSDAPPAGILAAPRSTLKVTISPFVNDSEDSASEEGIVFTTSSMPTISESRAE